MTAHHNAGTVQDENVSKKAALWDTRKSRGGLCRLKSIRVIKVVLLSVGRMWLIRHTVFGQAGVHLETPQH